MRVGYEWVHSIVDDHSRLAYSELHRDERAATVTGFVERALAFYAAHGIEPKRLLSDNAFVYRHNRSLPNCSPASGIRHLLIPTRRPQVNGKVERYQQTLKREWALGQVYRSATTAPRRCHTGCATTTSADHTAHSAADHRSAASTTSRGRTSSALDEAPTLGWAGSR